MALTQEQEEIIQEIIEAYENGKTILDLPDAQGTNPANQICEVLESGESKKMSVASMTSHTVHTTSQTLTDSQKAQARQNIGAADGGALQQILLTTIHYNETDYPLLQPTAYDSETGYFECESMPSWAVDGAYTTLYRKEIESSTIAKTPKSTSSLNVPKITVIDSTHFSVSFITVPDTVDCSLFAFCAVENGSSTGITFTTEGLDVEYYRIEWDRYGQITSRYPFPLSFNRSQTLASQSKVFAYCRELSYISDDAITSTGFAILEIHPSANSITVISGMQVATRNAQSISPMSIPFNKLTVTIGASTSGIISVRGGAGGYVRSTPDSEIRVYRLKNYR